MGPVRTIFLPLDLNGTEGSGGSVSESLRLFQDGPNLIQNWPRLWETVGFAPDHLDTTFRPEHLLES